LHIIKAINHLGEAKTRAKHGDCESGSAAPPSRAAWTPNPTAGKQRRSAITLEGLLKEKRKEILCVAARHGARNVRVFGPLARCAADSQSDIDLPVEFEPDRSLLDHAALWLELQDLMGCKVEVVSEGGVKARIRDRVLREAVPV